MVVGDANVVDQEALLGKALRKQPCAVYDMLPYGLANNRKRIGFSADGSMYSFDLSGLSDGKGVSVRKGMSPGRDDGRTGSTDLGLSQDMLKSFAGIMFSNIPSYRDTVDYVNYYSDASHREEFLKVCIPNGLDDPYLTPLLMLRTGSVVKRLEDAVAKTSPEIRQQPYIYGISNEGFVNAYCGYGRTLEINKGTFDFVGNDDNRLAAIIAHEMGHGEKLHHLYSTYDSANLAFGAALLSTVVGRDADMRRAFVTAVKRMDKETISKANERMADYCAFQYMVDAGFNPGALAGVHQHYLEQPHIVAMRSEVCHIVNPYDHPKDEERRDNFAKMLSDYSKGRLKVEKGVLFVDGVKFVSPGPMTDNGCTYSKEERSYLVMGNLAVAFHDGLDMERAYADGNRLMLGDRLVMTCGDGDLSAEYLAKSLNLLNGKYRENGEEKKETRASRFDFLKQYDADGNRVALPYTESVEINKVFSGFSDRVNRVMEQASRIAPDMSDEEVGRRTGRALVELLEGDDAVRFVTVLGKAMNAQSQEFLACYGKYAEEGKHMNDSYVFSNEEKYGFDRSLENLGFSSAHSGVSSSADKPESFRKDVGVGNDVFALLVRLRGEPNVWDAVRGEVAKSPKALANLERIESLGDQIVNDFEAVRLNALGRRDGSLMLRTVVRDSERLLKCLRTFNRSDTKKGYSEIHHEMILLAPRIRDVKNILYKGMLDNGKDKAEKEAVMKDYLAVTRMEKDIVSEFKTVGSLENIRTARPVEGGNNFYDTAFDRFSPDERITPADGLTERQCRIVGKVHEYVDANPEKFESRIHSGKGLPAEYNWNPNRGETGREYYARLMKYMESKGFNEYLDGQVEEKVGELVCNLEVRNGRFVASASSEIFGNKDFRCDLGNNKKKVYGNLVEVAEDLVLGGEFGSSKKYGVVIGSDLDAVRRERQGKVEKLVLDLERRTGREFTVSADSMAALADGLSRTASREDRIPVSRNNVKSANLGRNGNGLGVAGGIQ